MKKGVIYGARKPSVPTRRNFASLAFNVVGVAWEATESADTRCWGLLPDKIQVLRIELPAGEHQLTLQPTNVNGARRWATSETVRVQVRDGRNTYVLANFPDARSSPGQIVTNSAGK